MNILPNDWQTLKEDAANIISKIDVRDMTHNDYLALGASLAILDHKEGNPVSDYPNPQDGLTDAPSPLVDEVSPFDEQWMESDRFFEDYKKHKGLQLRHGSLEHGVLAKDALKKMLENDMSLMLALYRGADADERALIRESYERTLEKMK